ncbi:glycosyl transferase [Spirochaetia bacterium]|nr:glycosyl transferase [Spirochaetia bacterium]
MKAAIVHYWLVSMRGGEKVLEALLEMFPEADVYTHVYDRAAVSPIINSHKVYTSYIQKLPLAKKLYQKYMPLMPNALNEFNLQGYDLIISSESGPAKGVVPNPDAFHICYCHSPMRYLWDMYHEYFRGANPVVRFFMKRMIPGLRLWDIASANLVDHFIANSRYVAQRIRRYYNREADIVFPPAAIEKYLPVERKPEDFYLFFGQLAGYKRADIAIEACIASGRKLVVAGSGAKKKDSKRYKKSGLISFTGRISDEEVGALLSRAKALLFPGIEDFGIVPVEAAAAGCPVIAYRKGGVLDTVKENVTGIFFDEQIPTALAEAMDRFESMEAQFSDRVPFTNHVRQFSKKTFIDRITQIIAERKRI